MFKNKISKNLCSKVTDLSHLTVYLKIKNKMSIKGFFFPPNFQKQNRKNPRKKKVVRKEKKNIGKLLQTLTISQLQTSEQEISLKTIKRRNDLQDVSTFSSGR